MNASTTGKHGSANVRLIDEDIFTGRRQEELSSSIRFIYCRTVTKTEYLLLSINPDGLKQWNSGHRVDVIREVLNNHKYNEHVFVTVISSIGQEGVTGFNKR